MSDSTVYFAQPNIGLAASVAVLVLLVAVSWRYQIAWNKASTWCRVIVLLFLSVLLADPRMRITESTTEPGTVAVLLDDSVSMRIEGPEGRSRAQRMGVLLDANSGALHGALRAQTEANLVFYRFGQDLHELATNGSDLSEQMRFGDGRSLIGRALGSLLDSPIAPRTTAVIVVTDGGAGELSESLKGRFATEFGSSDAERLRSASKQLQLQGKPLFVVDLHDALAGADIEVLDVSTPARIRVGERTPIDVRLRASGLNEATTAPVLIEVDGLLQTESEVVLQPGQDVYSTRVYATFDAGGARRLVARVLPPVPDAIADNDRLVREINVSERPIRVLHWEGEPRYEVKFLRRAVHSDASVLLHSSVRTAENRYLQLGYGAPGNAVAIPANEQAGLPQEAAELFRYDLIVLGSVDSSMFSNKQIELLRQFVSRRGGGIIFLGGRMAFAEGQHGRTALASLMPVALSEPERGFATEVAPKVTDYGLGSDLLPGIFPDLFASERFAASVQAKLSQLPTLMVVNRLTEVRPGARVLLSGVDTEGGNTEGGDLVLLAEQRIGHGTTMAFAARNTWRWQMHADVEIEDQTHERLWRSLLRRAGRYARAPVELRSDLTAVVPGERVTLRVNAFDSSYQPLSDSTLQLSWITPNAEHRELVAEATGDGDFIAQFVPREIGRHELRVKLGNGEESVLTINVDAFGNEYRQPDLGNGALSALAASTGGKSLSASEASQVASLLRARAGQNTRIREISVREWEWLGIVVLLLLLAEWLSRRRRRLT